MADEDDALDGAEQAEEARPAGSPDLSDPVAQRERKKRLKHLERERAEVLRALLSTPAGRRLFAWLVHDICGLYRPVANAAFDAQALHFREGSRAVGQVLHDQALRDARDQYMVLLSETLPKP